MKTDKEYLEEINQIVRKYVLGDAHCSDSMDKLEEIFRPLWD